MPLDLAAALAREIDPSATKILPFDGFVFICGGPLPPEQPANTVASVRQFAVRKANSNGDRIAGRRLIIAERATALMQRGQFDDLLEFEVHLGALSSCVLIFLESPGAIAELGSFSVMHALRDKVFVVSEQIYSAQGESFIELGPLATLRNRNKQSVCVYPMHMPAQPAPIPNNDLIDECWDEIESAIERFSKRAVKESDFQHADVAHQLLLIAEFVGLFQALRTGELAECLRAVGCTVGKREVERSVKLLEKFGILESRQWGHEIFYVPKETAEYARFRRPQGAIGPFDRLRFRMDRLAEYESGDERKHKALKALRKIQTSS